MPERHSKFPREDYEHLQEATAAGDDGRSGSADRATLAMAKWICGEAHRLDPTCDLQRSPVQDRRAMKKGSKVYLEGSLQTCKWQDKEGHDRYSTEVVLQGFNSHLIMLDTRAGGASADTSDNDFGDSSAAPGKFGDVDDETPFSRHSHRGENVHSSSAARAAIGL
jgi:hypothetical protein